jgi:uncharacterized protein YcsI (UPF0317 family)
MVHDSGPILPPQIITPIDIGRLIRELEVIDETMLQVKLRQEGDSSPKLPSTSGLMDKLVAANDINLLHEDHRKDLMHFLTTIRDHSPLVHMSFSADPSALFLEKVTTWMRREINQYMLMTVGMQPNIGVGCVLRTTNHYFDMSLKTSFDKSKGILNQMFNVQPAEAVSPAPEAAPIEAPVQ